AIMRAAAERGHSLFVAEQGDLILRQDKARLISRSFAFSEGERWYQLDAAKETAPEDFDAVIMRKDPPFDNEFLYSTYLLEIAANQGAYVLNNPASIRDWNEKLSVALFPQFAPAFLVTREQTLIREFLAEHSDIVVKPLDGMGGSSVFRLTKSDPNIGVILETITDFGKRTIMAQRYLPQIVDGDKRVIIINGEPVPYALARIPQAGETRGNLAAGGKGVAQALTVRDLEIATTVGKVLREKGLFLVGLDVIGEHLTEINVTSPTGMVEIAAQTDCKPADLFMDALEQSVKAF
ncbi:MAG: glutathione synthase, partial [Nitrosomonadales bacterium]|nr:glutathione synthase [Nitrosomonadales bacterium]